MTEGSPILAPGAAAPPAPLVPRWLPLVGAPVLAALLAVALWAWARFGEGVFFDTIVGGIAACL